MSIKKVSGVVRQDTGVGFYRILQPLMFIHKTGIDIKTNYFTGQNEMATIGNTNTGLFLGDKVLMDIGRNADVIWTTIIYDYSEICKILDLRKWSGAKWVVDIDDDLYNVPSVNPARKNVDQLQDNIEKCLKIADGLTVSVPQLKERYKHLNKYIFINPNAINLKNWKITKKKHKGIRIGWRGAADMIADVQLVNPALKELKKNYNITFVTQGVRPLGDCEHHNWVGLMKLPQRLDNLDIDIALAPWVDSLYNQCKSNLAIQEWSALKVPVVASPVGNQKNMPVLYAKNNHEWYKMIEKLIKNADLRKKMGEEQYDFIKKHYNLKDFTPSLIDWMDKLPRKEISKDFTVLRKL